MRAPGAKRAVRRIAACAALVLFLGEAMAQSQWPSTGHFRYRRTVRVTAPGLNCAVVDPEIYARAASSLADLRLFEPGGRPVPFVLTQSGTAGGDATEATVTGMEQRGKALEFDLHMPARPYTDVVLQMDGRGFLATAEVSAENGGRRVDLGRFGIFDLRAEELVESTVLHLEETHAPVLHVRLQPLPGSTPLQPEMVRGATVPPSREAQTLFTPAVTTDAVQPVVQGSEAWLLLPAHVPIERVLVRLRPGSKENFLRTVEITSRPKDTSARDSETVTGTIDRVHLERDGVPLADEHMAVPATLGANLQSAAEVTVLIRNQRLAPLPIESVSLETRERRICFSAQAPGEDVLFYGDPAGKPGRSDLPRGLLDGPAHVATLGTEQLNPAYTEQTEQPSFRSRHPRLVYLSLMIGACIVGLVALRSAKLRM